MRKRTFSAIVLVFMAAGINAGEVQAQINQIIRTAVDQVPTDIFQCGNGNSTCNLTYRIYGEAAPGEVNGPANPVDGIPQYSAASARYFTDAQTTSNFPSAAAAGPGNEWYVVWDGITGPGTPQHAGWYGTQSEMINLLEPHGCMTFNCLPCLVTGPCFRTLNPLNGFNDTVRANGSVLEHIGGISPIPCPSVSENGVDTLTFTWEQAENITTNDGASEGVAGYDLYLLPDPLSAPSDMDLSAATNVASLPRTETSVTLSRTSLSETSGLLGSTTYVAAIKLRYAGGKESPFFSCNSELTGVATLDSVQEQGDAASKIDVQQAFVERRDGNLLVVTLILEAADLIVNKNDFWLHFDSAGGDKGGNDGQVVRMRVRRNGRTGQLVVRFDASFAANLEAFSSVDEANGRVQFVIDATSLAGALGSNMAMVSGVAKNGADRDRFDLGSLSF